MRNLLGHGELYLVKTEDDGYLGTVEITEGRLVVRSGLAERPVLLAAADVVRITPAHEHSS